MPVRLASSEEPLPGYRLLERLGRGGFGEVWKVEAPGGLHKAMKFVFGDLDSADDEGRPAEQELKALHRVKTIRHPYILSIERFDIIDGQLIIVMELADRNLWDRFRECRTRGLPGIPREELLRYMEESAEALDLMNNQYQIQHLDIKPQNLFLVHNHVKVADFGLAKDFEGARGTMTGGVTPVYAAPETFEGYLSRFTDQYSLGIVFQELLTGTRPFTGANTKQLLLQHLNSPPDLTSLPEADRPVVGRSLAKKPDERWPSCTELVRALRQAGAAAPTVAAPTVVAPAHPPAASPPPAARPPGSPPAPSRPALPLPPPNGPVSTPLPGLVTPRLVTPQAAAGGVMPAVTLQRPQVFQTARMTSLGIAPPEKSGAGVLFPALVVGVGATGLAVLQAVRRRVRERVGSADAVPNVRFLYVDTDPETAALATRGPDALPARQVVVARLNRPAHYLQRDGLPPVEQWLPEGLLYQLPKNPGAAAGVRAFGRLALCDNYRTVAQRIRQEVETFLSDDPLDRAGEATGLGVRSNRPRVYVLAGLAGGTGGGMAVDLAFIVKHELRAVGYRKPEAVGLLFVPPADPTAARTPALANAHAALAEIGHFQAGAKYQTRFDNAEPPITDADGPFARAVVLPFPKSSKERERTKAFGAAAEGLALDLLTPAGRVADAVRAAAAPAAGPTAHTFGVYRLSWPRPELLAVAARRFDHRLLLRWAAKDPAHLKEPIARWLADQWVKQRLDPVSVGERLDAAVRAALQADPTAVFDDAVAALRSNTPGGRLDPQTAVEVLDYLIRLVGRPATGESDAPGTVGEVVFDTQKKLAAEAEAGLATLAVSFMEQPQYRLAGAEEALAQLAARLKRELAALEPVRAELAREVAAGYGRLVQGLAAGGRLTADLTDHLRAYPTVKFQLARLDGTLSLYRGLLGNIPEYQREVNICRTRLHELAAGLGEVGVAPPGGPGEMLLPAGCDTLEAAADAFLAALPPEDILAFDQELQAEVKKKFRGVVAVCLKPERSADFLALLADRTRGFVDARLERADPAAVLLAYRGDGPAVHPALAKAYAAAAPAVPAGAAVVTTAVLAAPPGPAGDRVRALFAEAVPAAALTPADLADDIVVYREAVGLPLTALPQLGEVGREAYTAHSGGDKPLHTRADVPWAVPGGA